MADAEKIIKNAPGPMEQMLKSVYEYNLRFLLTDHEEELLNKVLFAMSRVDRKFFYSEDEAYVDAALPIGHGQTISQPSTVARMLVLADLHDGDDVLEVGTGSGWNVSLLAYLTYPGNASSIERIFKLVEKAEKNVAGLRGFLKQKYPHDVEKISKLNLFAENIFEKGKIWKKKYDKIIITAGIDKNEKTEHKIKEIAEKLLKQKGILICPRTSGPMVIYKKDGKLQEYTTKEEYVFVPLLNQKPE
jgi:protein-L-isoaspartate(D-aspartate) O-methyltransferase